MPDLLKSAYGHPPAVALFATNARYKREAYRGSEFAPRILNQHGLSVVMKSDHFVLNERDLLFEAQQAFYYGLPWNVALASVTSTAADVLGYGHRVGYIKRGIHTVLMIVRSHGSNVYKATMRISSYGTRILSLWEPHQRWSSSMVSLS